MIHKLLIAVSILYEWKIWRLNAKKVHLLTNFYEQRLKTMYRKSKHNSEYKKWKKFGVDEKIEVPGLCTPLKKSNQSVLLPGKN